MPAERLVWSSAGDAGPPADTGRWETISLLPSPLPGFALDAVDLGARFLGRRIGLPVLLERDPRERAGPATSAALLAAAQQYGVPVNLGPLESIDPSVIGPSQEEAAAATPVPLLAELSVRRIAQSGFDVGAADRIRQLQLQAVILRLDLAEAAIVEPEHATNSGLELVETLTRQVPVPLIPRDPTGLPRAAARALADRGIESLITGGAEVFAASLPGFDPTGEAVQFAHWGVPALAAIRMLRGMGVVVVSDAGVAGGLEAAKAIALGADLLVLRVSGELPRQSLDRFARGLRTTMYLSGARNLNGLKSVPFVATGATREWLEAAESLWRSDSSPRS